MHFRPKLRSVFLYITLLVVINQAKAQSPAFEQSIETSANQLQFLAYLPPQYTKTVDQSYPLLLFLHGLGERGENIETVKRHGPPSLLKKGEWDPELPFIVISPQLPSKYNSWPVSLIDDFLNEIIQRYRIDTKRIYLTGLSLGGIATWNYAVQYPNKLAAIIPVCGKGSPRLACNLGSLPVWAFHGDRDRTVKPEGSIEMINALLKCPSRTEDQTKMTLYPNVGHNSWTRTYSDFSIYKWLLQFRNDNSPLKASPQQQSEGPILNIGNKDGSHLKELFSLPAALRECSGLQYFGNGSVWAHNDSGNLPVIYQLDSAGSIVQIKRITNAANFDWEDFAKDEQGNLYIGDFGNNNNNRRSLQIYKIENPENNDRERIPAEVISFTYSDQKEYPPPNNQLNFDVEAMIAFDSSLFLFTKNRTSPYSGYVKRYKLPTIPGEHTAELIDSLLLDNTHMITGWVTGADISPDKKSVVLLTSTQLWVFQDFEDDDFFNGSITKIPLPHLTQKEGITFVSNTEVYICDELFRNIGGKLYSLDLAPYINKSNPSTN